ncbi:MAG: DUF6377 domain-containing protein [Bacteroidales bacterium]|nr:DUF6377 domain-containing protein [Bacteroidales bacterium]
MKKILIPAVFALFLFVSCGKERSTTFALLDQAIENKEVFDLKHEQLQDSLRAVYGWAVTDSARWEAAYRLEKIFFYHDVDSCYSYVQKMLELQGKDVRRRGISGSCYANILYKMDSLNRALVVFEKVDTTDLGIEGFRTYGFAGYHIYRKLLADYPAFDDKCHEIIDRWWQLDSTNVECAYYHNEVLRRDGIPVDGLQKLRECNLTSPNDTAKAYYFMAWEHLNDGNVSKAMECFSTSATYDLRVSAKAYNALYELARILFRRGDIRRADRYMRMTLEDARTSHYALRYNDIIQSEFEIMNVVLKQEKHRHYTYILGIVSVSLMLLVALALVFLLGRYSNRLTVSQRKLSEVSNIKDSFLANYMEKCVDYLNKVDEYRSSLRRTAKEDGADAIMAQLRKPSFAAGEFSGLLTSLDSTFLGIFPDFVDKVNAHMQEPYRLEMPKPGVLSTELRILALIKMGISKRQKIAKILNMSVTTVYSYHCNLQKHSLLSARDFDRVIASL